MCSSPFMDFLAGGLWIHLQGHLLPQPLCGVTGSFLCGQIPCVSLLRGPGVTRATGIIHIRAP